MDKKKIYIFFAGEIITIGGMQMYTAGKVKYLEDLGWQVFVFYGGSSKGKSAIPSLNKYMNIGGDCYFFYTPPYKFKRYEQEQILNLLIQKVINNITGGGDIA